MDKYKDHIARTQGDRVQLDLLNAIDNINKNLVDLIETLKYLGKGKPMEIEALDEKELNISKLNNKRKGGGR